MRPHGIEVIHDIVMLYEDGWNISLAWFKVRVTIRYDSPSVLVCYLKRPFLNQAMSVVAARR